MREGLWSVKFKTNSHSFGEGVIVLDNGQVLGGDSSYTYVGMADVNNGVVSATVEVKRYNAHLHGIFGSIPKYTLKLTGNVADEHLNLNATMVEHPQHKMVAELVWRAPLP